MCSAALKQTPLHAWHAAHGGKLVDFAGWSMPIQYSSIVSEHHATRRHVTLFDVSHMGRFRFTGEAVATFLDSLVTRRVTDMAVGQIRYSLVTNERGGILDDVLVYRLADEAAGADGREAKDRVCFGMVVNAANRTKIADWIQAQPGSQEIDFLDQTTATAMIAVQGPRALSTFRAALDVDASLLAYYTSDIFVIHGVPCLVSRTGYTGEDGVEITVSAELAERVWCPLMEAGQAVGIQAAGLGARDTLRLEAGMPLYGHELSEQVNPFQAGLGFAVNLKDRAFVGASALRQCKQDATQPRRVGLRLAGKRIAREHYPIVSKGRPIGEITSGTYSPTLEESVAMGMIESEFADVGTEVAVDIRGRETAATVTALPFYRRAR